MCFTCKFTDGIGADGSGIVLWELLEKARYWGSNQAAVSSDG